jgi:hypothetical protein
MFNKKGEEKYLSIWNVIVWVFLLGTVVIALAIFNNSKTDIRIEEARILAVRTADCLVKDGKITSTLQEFNIFEECNLNQRLIEESGIYRIEIKILDFKTKEIINEYSIGNRDLALQCAIKKDEEHFASCYHEKIFTTLDDKEILLEINTASNHIEEGPL